MKKHKIRWHIVVNFRFDVFFPNNRKTFVRVESSGKKMLAATQIYSALLSRDKYHSKE